MSREKNIIYTARIVSLVFTPFYLPLVGLVVLFTFTRLSQFSASYRLQVLLLVYLFTILLPTLFIHLYRKYQGWTRIELGQKQRRMVPYAISILCYFACIWVLKAVHVHHLVPSIIVAALFIQMFCAIINVWWKISTHTAGIGGVAGALIVFSAIFGFNPIWWLCGVLILGGVLGTARMILRQHSLAQVLCGFFVGLVCSFYAIVNFTF